MRFNFALNSTCCLFLAPFYRDHLLRRHSLPGAHPDRWQTCECANLLPQLLVVTRKFKSALWGR
jgi:hypothetical protein